MTKYEYLVAHGYHAQSPEALNQLNRLGEQGWELVSVSEGKFYFKRIKKDEGASS